MANARFSLCPRGVCAGSIRLFESMKMGRACVIISDAWQPNDGVDWDSFSIRVPEAEVHRIPAILEEHADRAAEMGRCARLEWEKWFAPQVAFHRVVELCLDIRAARTFSGTARRLFDMRHILLHPRSTCAARESSTGITNAFTGKLRPARITSRPQDPPKLQWTRNPASTIQNV